MKVILQLSFVACVLLLSSCETETTNQTETISDFSDTKKDLSDGSGEEIDSICECELNTFLKFSPNVPVYDTVNGERIDEIIYNIVEHEAGFNVDFENSFFSMISDLIAQDTNSGEE